MLLQRLIIEVATSKLVIWVCQEAAKVAEEIKVQIHMAILVHMVKAEDLVWQVERVRVGHLQVPQGDGDQLRCLTSKPWVFLQVGHWFTPQSYIGIETPQSLYV